MANKKQGILIKHIMPDNEIFCLKYNSRNKSREFSALDQNRIDSFCISHNITYQGLTIIDWVNSTLHLEDKILS